MRGAAGAGCLKLFSMLRLCAALSVAALLLAVMVILPLEVGAEARDVVIYHNLVLLTQVLLPSLIVSMLMAKILVWLSPKLTGPKAWISVSAATAVSMSVVGLVLISLALGPPPNLTKAISFLLLIGFAAGTLLHLIAPSKRSRT